MTTKLYYLFGLIMLSLFSIWLVIQVNQDGVVQQSLAPTVPNAYATQLTLTELDEQGHVKSRFYAVKATHYPNNVTDLDVPRAILYNTIDSRINNTLDVSGMLEITNTQDTPPWTIHAKHGQIRDHGETLYLWGDVHVEQAKGPKNHATALTTSQLTYYPKTRQAYTKKVVHIKQSNGNTVDATGMKANLNSGDIIFLSDMRGRYEVQ